MNKTVMYLFVLLMLSKVTTTSGAEAYYKKEQPELLPLDVQVRGNCPFDESRARATVVGELLRSGIEPIDWRTEEGRSYHLSVHLTCLNATAFVEIGIGLKARVGKGESWARTNTHNGILDFGENAEYLLNAVKARVERFITQYRQANFDL